MRLRPELLRKLPTCAGFTEDPVRKTEPSPSTTDYQILHSTSNMSIIYFHNHFIQNNLTYKCHSFPEIRNTITFCSYITIRVHLSLIPQSMKPTSPKRRYEVCVSFPFGRFLSCSKERKLQQPHTYIQRPPAKPIHAPRYLQS